MELVCTFETYDWLVLCVGCSACGLTSVSTCSQRRVRERELEFGERPSWKSGALSATTRERVSERRIQVCGFVCVSVWLEKESEREIAIVLL